MSLLSIRRLKPDAPYYSRKVSNIGRWKVIGGLGSTCFLAILVSPFSPLDQEYGTLRQAYVGI